MKLLIGVIFGSFWSIYSLGQYGEFVPSMQNISEFGGIPSREVYSVFHDSKGNIWFCTDAGVTKFDGYYYTTYTEEDGLQNNVVFNVYEDPKGRIWFLTLNPELCYLENDVVHQYEHNDIIKKISSGYPGVFLEIYMDKSNCLYYSVKGAGLFKILPSGEYHQLHGLNKTVNVTKVEEEYIISVIIDHSRTTSAVKMENWHFPVLFKDGKNQTNGGTCDPERGFNKQDVKLGMNHFVVVGGSLFSIRGAVAGLKDVLVASADPVDKDVLWVGTRKGLKKGRIIDNRFVLDNEYLDECVVTGICWDSEKSGWFSTLNMGVFFCNNFDLELAESANHWENNVIAGITGINGKIYLSTRDYCYEFGTDSLVRFKSSQFCKIGAWKGNLIISSGADWNKDLKNHVIRTEFLRGLKVKGDMLYGVSRHVFKVDLNTFKVDTLFDGAQGQFSSRKMYLRDVEVLEDGRVIVGGPNGLGLVENGKVTNNFLQTESLGLDVSEIFFDKRWGLIVATVNKGVFIFNEQEKTIHLTTNNGLVSNRIRCVTVSNDGSLFIGTNRGMNYVFPDSPKIFLLSRNTGLENDDVCSVYSNDRYVFIGTRMGMYRIRIDRLLNQRSDLEVPVQLDYLLADQRMVNVPEGALSLSNSFNVLRIRFRVNNFSNWFNKKYQYRLKEGDEWIEVSSPEIVLYRPSGEMNVEVRYLNENNTWSKSYFLIQINVDLPIWERWYFWLLCSLVISAFFIFFYRRKQIRKKRDLELKNELLSLEQRMHSARMNPHFIFNVLNSIQGFMMFNENEKAERYLVKFSTLMRSVLDNSSAGQIYLRDEVEIVERYLELEQLRGNGGFQFEVISSDVHDQLIPTMLIQPFVENAVFHGVEMRKKEGKIVVKFEQNGDFAVKVTVFNNKEISLAQIEKIEQSEISNAVGITKARLKNYARLTGSNQFKVSVTNEFEGMSGTAVVIILPILVKEA